MTNNDLKKLYHSIEKEYYNNLDPGHNAKHLKEVAMNAYKLSNLLFLSERKTYLAIIAAIYHDTGLKIDRRKHNIHSYNIVLHDDRLKKLLSDKEISIVANAVKNHRNSAPGYHKHIVSKVLADADNIATVERHIERSYLFNLHNFGTENIYENVKEHVTDKFGRNGKAKLILKVSRELPLIEENYKIIENEELFLETYNRVKDRLCK